MALEIGTAQLLETTDIRQHYECAAWYQVVRVPAGHTARIMVQGYAINQNPEHPEGYALGTVCGLEGSDCWWDGGCGIIVDSNFSSLLGGVSVTSLRGRDNGREASAATIHPYRFTVAEALATQDGRMGPWQLALDPEFEVVSRPYTGHAWDEIAHRYLACEQTLYQILPCGVAKPSTSSGA